MSAGTVEYTDCFSAEGQDLPNECPDKDTSLVSEGEAPIILEIWRMQSTPSLPSLPGPFCLEVVVPNKGALYGLNRIKPCTPMDTHIWPNIHTSALWGYGM